MRIMPRYIPYHKPLVYLSGLTEIAAGIGVLFISTRTIALWGIVAMLLLFFPVHIYMLVNEKAGLDLPKYLLVFRLFLQFGLIYWAYQYL